MSTNAFTRVAPFGLRFWDDALSQVVTETLRVRALPYPLTRLDLVVTGVRGASGGYGFHHLPGLETTERGEVDLALGTMHPRVLVDDPRGDFLPVAFTCAAPQVGFAAPDGAAYTPRALVPVSAGAPTHAAPLFSSPTRAAAGGAQVQGELRYTGTGAPASWALVELRDGSTLVARALADAAGRFSALFPYPPLTGGLTDPAAWDLTLRVFHDVGAAAGDRADLDEVFQFTGAPDLRLGARGAFTTTLNVELQPGRMVVLGLLELQP